MSAQQANFFDQVTQYFTEAARFTDLPKGTAGADSRLQQRLSLRLPAAAQHRRHRSDSRLAGRAQPSQDAGQGRHPLQPRRLRRRGDGARRADDLQVRDRRRALRRRQGRHQDRAEELFASTNSSASRGATRRSSPRRASSVPASTCRRRITAPASARWRGLPTPTPRSIPDSSMRSGASPASRSRRAACAAARKRRDAGCISRCAKRATNPTR